MAAHSAAAGKRAVQLFGTNRRPISEFINSTNGKRLFLVDTLALVRKLEAQGVPSKQAEAITSAMTEVLNDSVATVSSTFVSKAEMEKSDMTQESNLSEFMYKVEISQEQLKADIQHMRDTLAFEVQRVTTGQQLDLSLEKGKIQGEMNKQTQETTHLTAKLDLEIHTVKAQLETAKYEVIKYCIGTLASVSAVSLAVVRILM